MKITAKDQSSKFKSKSTNSRPFTFRVLNSPKEQQLSNLMELSQNFPSYARPLSKTSVPKDLKKEVKKNRDIFFEKMSVQPSDAALFINGLYFDMDFVDIFTILETIKSEAKVCQLFYLILIEGNDFF